MYTSCDSSTRAGAWPDDVKKPAVCIRTRVDTAPILIAAICAVTAGCSPAPRGSDADDRAALDRIRQQFEAAENAGDADAMYRHLADDIVVMPPNAPPMRGSEVNPASLGAHFDMFDVDVQYRSEEIVIAGDWAFDRGTAREILTPKQGGAPFGGEGKYLWVYRRVGGEWKQARVIWNSSEPAPGGGGPAPPSQ
jgi:ketosteroid isomerase-like protein